MVTDTKTKRIAIEVDRYELAAVINYHSSNLAKVGAGLTHSFKADADDLYWAERTAIRLQDLVKIAQAFAQENG